MVRTAAVAALAAEPGHHNLDLAMQKYLALHSQHEELTQYLDVIRPPTRAGTWASPSPTTSAAALLPASASSSSPPVSLSSSPTSSVFSLSSSSSAAASWSPPRRARTTAFHAPTLPPPNVNASSTSSLDTVWDEDVMCEVEAEEQRLSSVNEGIKRALTELLNCEAVRSDRSLRMWVQCRLMETEKELRSGRRKRSAAY
jgi:hypothetical protein